MDPRPGPHPPSMPSPLPAAAPGPESPLAPSVPVLYDAHARFVFRSLRVLGVADADLDDAVQDVFVVVHRRLADFDGRAKITTWLYAIVRRVAAGHRRRSAAAPLELDAAAKTSAPSPEESFGRQQAFELLLALTADLDPAIREAFILSDIIGMSAPEIADIVEANESTVYSRVRLGRRHFERALARHRAREGSP
jgi:RNA polymerase sigma-70 factor, ECF subfamily